MNISFTVDARALQTALQTAQVYTPNGQGEAKGGWLWTCEDNLVRIYGVGSTMEIRCTLQISDLEGSGSFVIPVDAVPQLRLLTSGSVRMRATEDNGVFRIHYQSGKASETTRTSLNPATLQGFEDQIENAHNTVEPVAISAKWLQYCLGLAGPYCPKETPIEHQKTIRWFGDGGADGYCMAVNSRAMVFIYHELQHGVEMSIHQSHFNTLRAYLSRVFGNLKLYTLPTKYYFESEYGDCLGIPKHAAQHSKFNLYKFDEDLVWELDPSETLRQLRFIKAGLRDGNLIIRVHIDSGTIWFSHKDEINDSSSAPVEVKGIAGDKVGDSYRFQMDVDNMIQMFSNTVNNPVQFRVRVVEPNDRFPRGVYYCRVVDEYRSDRTGDITTDDGHVTKTIRFSPSLE